MAIQIDETLYRSLYNDAMALVRSMVPQVAEHALKNDKDPGEAVGDAIDVVFKRVLQGFEKLGAYTKDPAKRPANMRPKQRVNFT